MVLGAILSLALFFDEYLGFKPRAHIRHRIGWLGVLMLAVGLVLSQYRPSDRAGSSSTKGIDPADGSHVVIVSARDGFAETTSAALAQVLQRAEIEATTSFFAERMALANDRVRTVRIDYQGHAGSLAERVEDLVRRCFEDLGERVRIGAEPMRERGQPEPHDVRVFLRP